MSSLLPHPGLTPAVFSLRTGIPVHLLRRYDERGLLTPAEVDPGTGWRRYAPGQIGAGRLLHALRATGMGLGRAAGVVASGDRSAVIAHIARVEELLQRLRDHLPVDGAERVVAVRERDVVGLQVPLVPGAGLVDQLRGARARLARQLGLAVSALPRAACGHPADGPWVELSRAGEGSFALRTAALPWDPGEPVPPGWTRCDRRGGHRAAVPLADAELAAVVDGSPAGAAEVLRDRLAAPDGGFAVGFAVLLDASLAQAHLAVLFSPW
ncbi:MerR family transcriptional regulator [Quadrisphaera sp. DSM 44207]|uniref:MerR family transcriptional regulator n=1 Tax=Quadrisphaera sp. DSM 44207 TaxID=1881057 RepID=UPI000888D590|nr:MerR family transcriptional regulator [Quadrisphaera sp. DSM 44207]SDQ86836.1 DNA-binding transcriptional regulator, MerR family [Quadrisphaera sp. DSM 44207]